MHRLDEKGKLFLESLELPQEKITQQLVFDIISLQNKLNPYSSLESQEIRWKINKKERQGGHLNIDQFRERFFALEY